MFHRVLTTLLCALLLTAASPSRAWAAPWSFAVITDTQGSGNVNPDNTGNVAGGVNTVDLANLVAALRNEPIDLLLCAGDLVQRYPKSPLSDMNSTTLVTAELDLWKSTVQALVDQGVPIYPIRGNHDKSAPAAVWKAAFPSLPANGPSNATGLTYSLPHENVLFVGIDDYAGQATTTPTAPQAWLDAQFAANTADWTFVFGHVAAFPQGNETGMCTIEDAAGNKLIDPAGVITRNTFWDSLDAGRVGAFFCGHEHLYARAWVPDSAGNLINQIVAGSGGAPPTGTGALYAESNCGISDRAHNLAPDLVGYLLVTVDGTHIPTGWFKALDTNGNFVTIDGPFPVPEPATLALLALGGLTLIRRRRK